MCSNIFFKYINSSFICLLCISWLYFLFIFLCHEDVGKDETDGTEDFETRRLCGERLGLNTHAVCFIGAEE